MVNKTNNSASHDDILDSFLTTIESKLRGPFSSLDLAKAVSTTALRGSSHIGSSSATDDTQDPAREYLNNLSSVFGRTNKVIQCRMLIGLLGLNDMRTNKNGADGENDNKGGSQYLTPEILRILHETQEGPLHEDWVRTTSGLIEGVMFRTDDSDPNGNTRESCRSEEASKIIRETGMEVCDKVECQIQDVGRPYESSNSKQDVKKEKGTIDEEKVKSNSGSISAASANKRNRGFTLEKVIPSSSQPAIKKEEKIQISIKGEQGTERSTKPPPPDLNACFAPYRYSLISTPTLNTIIPEFNFSKPKNNNRNGVSDSNCHFQVNPAASILQIDLKLEAQRAKEHGSGVPTKAKSSNSNKGNSPTKTANGGNPTFPPGFRPAKLVPTKRAASSSVGASKPGVRSGSRSLFMPKKKTSANLFNTTTKFRPQPMKTMLRRKGGGAQALVKNGATASGGGAILNKLGGGGIARSGMSAAGRTGRFSGNRDVARAGGKVSRIKMIDDDDVDALTRPQQSTASAAEQRASKRKRILEGGASSFANPRLKKQRARPGIRRMEPVMTKNIRHAAPQQQQQQITDESCQSLLRDRSNRMSAEDRIRVEKFFQTNKADRSSLLSPSDDGPQYKMKIHEQRGQDPATGEEIKQTFYLELDYNTGDFLESKKTKRY
ncbi:unnamed protein product [Pseudo-nitzschia multistriata]|uniref:Uncharacterized protein n=1 Tax=Pseudo-nitzschia multistriata TaxID=183589 RepID=A0A448ZER9_9STRA|nr:unnamed protein product [Pseudo-nitzschia multistriata]